MPAILVRRAGVLGPGAEVRAFRVATLNCPRLPRKENDAVVAVFAKLPEQFGFAIEYTDVANNLRYYEPDFVDVLAGFKHAH